MKKNLLAMLLAVVLIAAVVFIAAPATKAEALVANHTATAENQTINANAGDIVDLYGFHGVVINVSGEGAIKLVDTKFMEGEWDLSGDSAGSATVNGTVERSVQFNAYKYLAVEHVDEDNKVTYSAHPFNLTITKYGVNPSKNCIALRATYVADNVVRDLITEIGISDADESVSAGYLIPANTNGTHAYFDVNNSLASENLNATANIKAYIKLGDEKIESNYTYTLKPVDVLDQVNTEYPGYTGTTKEKADALYQRVSAAAQALLGNLNPNALAFEDIANRTAYSTTEQVWVQNGITFTNSKGESTTNVGDYSNPVRLYKNSTVTVAYTGMTGIQFTCDTAAYAKALAGAIADNYVIVEGKNVTVLFKEATDSFTVTLSVGAVWVDNIGVLTGTSCKHESATEKVTVPTCTEGGYTTYTCNTCGGSYVGDYKDATGS